MDLLNAENVRQRLLSVSELERRLSFQITRLSKLLDQDASQMLDGSDLNLTGYRILMILSVFGETSASDLARLMVIDRAQISRSVADLTRQGLLQGRTDPSNKRRRLLQLSRDGHRALAAVAPRFADRQRTFAAQLTEAEYAGLTAAIGKLSALLAQGTEHPTDFPDPRSDL